MKKREIRKKKTSIWQRVAILGVAAVMSSTTMTVQAAENLESQVYIYHEHRGSAENGDGCYTLPVYHEHEGNETEGGNCYQTPVYHVHEGDEQNGGACYGREIYHVHDGNSTEGGSCYKVVYHSHSSTCYKTVTNDEAGCTVVKVEDTTEDDYEGCDYKNYYMTCGTVVHGTNPSHTHRELTCKKEGKVEGFKLSCKLTELYVERYEMDCVKTEETIDSYSLSCPKTENDIDKYEMGCGRDETTPLGKITVTGQLTSSKRKANITAVYEDMSEGEVIISESGFTWYNESGKILGNGDNLQVTANGRYYVMLGVQNEDIKAESLKAEIQIKGIQKKKAEPKEDGSGDDSGKEEPSDDDGGGEDDSGNGNISGTPQPVSTATPSPSPSASPAETKTPTPAIVITDSSEGGNRSADDTKSSKIPKNSPEITPSPTPGIKKEIKTIKLEEKGSGKEEIVTVESIEQPDRNKGGGFWTTPAVKMITFTAGTLIILAGTGVLLFLLGVGVRVYNDDGKGNLVYLGRGIVKTAEEGYVLSITERMIEKSLTNRYCLRCDFFHLWKDKEEELIVTKGERRQIVKIQKEMIAVI